MDILPPLMRGIQLHLRHNHFRLYQLANLILKGKHSELMSGLTNDDPWLNEDTQVTLLHFAAAGGTVESIDYCLQQGIAINAPLRIHHCHFHPLHEPQLQKEVTRADSLVFV